MRNGKIVVCLFSALMLAVAVYIGVKEAEWCGVASLSVTIFADDGTEEITCWQNNEGKLFFFLPSHADLSRVYVQTNTTDTVFLNGQQLTDGMSCEAFQVNVPYDLSYIAKGKAHCFSLTFVQSAKVPAMYIDVPSGSMDYIHQEKGNEESGRIRLYTADGRNDYSGNLESIKGRGNATWNCLKKPYSLTLSAEADLLGMGQAKKWILLANAYDPSNLRNKIAYDFAAAIGMAYSPECEWVDLYLNGEYAGLYLLSERNEVHPQRIAIAEDNGFLISREGEARLIKQGYTHFSPNNGKAYRVHYSSMSLSDLQQMWQSAENAIFAEDGVDPITGKSLFELIDLDSWAKRYLVDEIFSNYDGGGISQYFYYDGNDGTGKIYAGPVWDMDITLAPGQWEISPPNSISVRRPAVLDGTDKSPFGALYEKDEFYEYMIEMYQTVCQPLIADLLNAGLDGYAARISQAAIANQIRWDMGDPAEETEIIRTFLEERSTFLNDLWLENSVYYDVIIVIDSEVWAWFAVRPGEKLPYIPEYENCEWCKLDSDEPFDISQPIYENAKIYLKEYVKDARQNQTDSGNERDNILIQISFVMLLGILIVICIVDRIQIKRTEKQKNDRTNHKISS